jgi:hypothetical protein
MQLDCLTFPHWNAPSAAGPDLASQCGKAQFANGRSRLQGYRQVYQAFGLSSCLCCLAGRIPEVANMKGIAASFSDGVSANIHVWLQ